jgi:uncharacterized protein (DUF305 family)
VNAETNVGATDPDNAAVVPDSTELTRASAITWWQALMLCAAVGLLGMAVGSWLAKPHHPGGRSVDVGYLQDMRAHHDQAVEMGLAYLDKHRSTVDVTLRTIAGEIVVGQMLENGIMVQTLASWGRAEQNESDDAMAWMGHAMASDAMPGMASRTQIQALRDAGGTVASALFVQLMLAHHEGGVQMAEYAAAHAKTSTVRRMATTVVRNQRAEISEIQSIATKLGLEFDEAPTGLPANDSTDTTAVSSH